MTGGRLGGLKTGHAYSRRSPRTACSYAETRFDALVFTLQGVGFKDSGLAAAPTISVYVDQVPRIRP